MGEELKRATCVLYEERARKLCSYLDENLNELFKKNILVRTILKSDTKEEDHFIYSSFYLHVSGASVLANSGYDRPTVAGRRFEVNLEAVGEAEQIRAAKSQLEKMSGIGNIPLVVPDD